jgi:hypothetical protein
MSTPESSVRVTGRCSVHPGSLAVAVCDGCGRRMCLACAVPVRGGTVGNECLVRVLGPDAPEGHPDDRRAPGEVAFLLAGVGFLAAVLAAILPWTNKLTSSHVRGFFGSLETSPVSWALPSAVAAVVGLAGWLIVWLRPSLRGVVALWLLAAVGLVAVAGAVLFIVAPPFATHPFLGPWLMLAAAGLATGASAAAAMQSSEGRAAASPSR